MEPSDMLQDVLLELGQHAARLIPEDRIVAQRLISVGLEMLSFGGSLMPAHVADQLGPFVGFVEANAQRRMPNRGEEELEAWRKTTSSVLQILLEVLYKKGVLESHRSADGEIWYSAA